MNHISNCVIQHKILCSSLTGMLFLKGKERDTKTQQSLYGVQQWLEVYSVLTSHSLKNWEHTTVGLTFGVVRTWSCHLRWRQYTVFNKKCVLWNKLQTYLKYVYVTKHSFYKLITVRLNIFSGMIFICPP